MKRNIRQVYETKDELLHRMEENLGPANRRELTFDRAELGGPVIVKDDLARDILTAQYLFATHFMSGRLPAIACAGGDFLEHEGTKYVTTNVYDLDFAQNAFTAFREIEPLYREWMERKDEVQKEISGLVDTLELSQKEHEFTGLAEELHGYVGFQGVHLPNEELVIQLETLANAFYESQGKDSQAGIRAEQLSEDIREYVDAKDKLAELREHAKTVPIISGNGTMIMTTSPAYSGRKSWHTAQAQEDCFNVLPSQNNLFLMSAQSGSSFVVHMGAGSTPGEHYQIHVPTGIFFDVMQSRVDSEGADRARIMQIKDDVLRERLDDIMSDEILGFQVDGTRKHRVVTISPVVTESEYNRHTEYLREQVVVPFRADNMLMEFSDGFAPFRQEVRAGLIQTIAEHGRFYKEKDE